MRQFSNRQINSVIRKIESDSYYRDKEKLNLEAISEQKSIGKLYCGSIERVVWSDHVEYTLSLIRDSILKEFKRMKNKPNNYSLKNMGILSKNRGYNYSSFGYRYRINFFL